MDEEEMDYNEIPIHVKRTRLLKSKLEAKQILPRVLDILNCIASNGLDLPLFLDAISWGSPECHSDRTVQYARTSLLASDELSDILQRWYKPPRRANDEKGSRPAGARNTLRQFITDSMMDILDQDMRNSAPLFASPSSELSEKHLLGLDFQELQRKVEEEAPTLWDILNRCATSPQQDGIVRKKNNPHLIAVSCIAQMQYSRSRHQNKFQKVWSMYFKACGLSARAFDAVHALGLTMSHKWAANAYGILSDRAMKEAQEAGTSLPSNFHVFLPPTSMSARLAYPSSSDAGW
ncbi:hypothetical protein D9613_009771 [Agrocybe pediades]|uniref:Uncharacterized protein n=1 Tax=Agrocybe pediades TaxID=84607 RepID=A0A8H4QWM6_9AGAR|nr:hypothetical protein D9613_009771 [Agrocybe pediades]